MKKHRNVHPGDQRKAINTVGARVKAAVRPHQRKRVLLPEYEAMMAAAPGNDVQAALDEIRADR